MEQYVVQDTPKGVIFHRVISTFIGMTDNGEPEPYAVTDNPERDPLDPAQPRFRVLAFDNLSSATMVKIELFREDIGGIIGESHEGVNYAAE